MTERTEKQRQTARENGKKSKGPLTRPTDLKSRFHQAICAKTVVLDNENAASFKLVLNHFRDHIRPLSHLEEALVEEMASAFWRMRRSWAIANSMLNCNLPVPDLLAAPDPLDPDAATPHNARALLAAFSDEIERTRIAFSSVAATPEYRILARQESALHRAFQRSIYCLAVVRRYLPAPPPPLDSANSDDSKITREPGENSVN